MHSLVGVMLLLFPPVISCYLFCLVVCNSDGYLHYLGEDASKDTWVQGNNDEIRPTTKLRNLPDMSTGYVKKNFKNPHHCVKVIHI